MRAGTEVGQEPRSRSGSRQQKGCCLVVAPHGLFNLVSYGMQDQELKDDTTQNGLGLHASITKKVLYSLI